MIPALTIAAELALGLGINADSGGAIAVQYFHPKGPFVEASALSEPERYGLLAAGWRWQAENTRLPPFFDLGLAYTTANVTPARLNLLIGTGFSVGPIDFRLVHISPGRKDEDRNDSNKNGLNYFLFSWRVK